MKKFLTLVLALVMVLAIAAPAMAFTTETDLDDDSSSPYELDIYLVEYDDGVFGYGAYLPPADRGYAKNEVVAAVVELVIPKGNDASGFTFKVTGENVTLQSSQVPNNVAYNVLDADFEADATTLALFDNDAANAKDKTFKWLVFAKVNADDASLTAKLKDGDNENDVDSASGVTFSVGDNKYNVKYSAPNYTITPVGTVDPAGWTKIEVKVSTKSSTKWDGQSITIYDDTTPTAVGYVIGFYLNGNIFFKNAATNEVTDKDNNVAVYRDLVDIYEDVIEGDLGLDATLAGKVKLSYFESFQSADSVEATVDIEPWTAYVTVPDNIVVDPPKTGDAASILGFVMIVLAAAAVVAVRKVRA